MTTIRISRRTMYRAKFANVARLARWIGIEVPAHNCPTCQRVLVERMMRHEAFR